MPSSRRAFLTGIASAGLLAAAGCLGGADQHAYRSYGYGPHNRAGSDSAGPTGSVEVDWRVDDAAQSQVPAVADGQVFLATDRSDGAVVAAVDAESGDQQWEYDAGSPVGGFRPAVADGTLYFVDSGGTAHAVSTDQGEDRWQRSLQTEQGISNSPIVVDDALVFGLGDLTVFEYGGLYALETDDGSTRWHREPELEGETAQPHTPAYPAAADSTVYYSSFGERGGTEVTAVDSSDGSTEWTAAPTGEIVFTGVAVTDDRLYLGGPIGQAAVDRDDRSLAWDVDGGALFSPPAVTGDAVYTVGVSGSGGRPGLRAVETDGTDRWTHTADTVVVAHSSPTVADGTVYYGGTDGHLYALDAADGARQWRFGENQSGFSTPVVVDGRVYVAAAGGLVALQSA